MQGPGEPWDGDENAGVAGAIDGIRFQERASELRLREQAQWSHNRALLATILESHAVEVFTAVLISLNFVLVYIDTNFRAKGDAPAWIHPSMLLVLLIYFIDLSIRLWVFRSQFFLSTMNVFDLSVVFLDVLAELIGLMDVEVLRFVSALRILRLGRLLRFIRLVTFFKELLVMCHLMVAAMRTIFWASILMTVMLVLWSIVAVEILHPMVQDITENTDLFDGCDRCTRAYSSVEHSCLTFFQHIIAGDAWGEVNIVIIERYPSAAIFLALVLVTMNLGLMNLVVTVIVDKAQEAREQNVHTRLQQQEQAWSELKRSLYKQCKSLDTNHNGELSLDEFLEGFNSCADFGNAMRVMGIDQRDMSLLYGVMDTDNSGSVSYAEYIDQLWTLKNQSTHSVCVMTKAYVQTIRNDLLGQFQQVHDEMRRVFGDSKDHDLPKVSETGRIESKDSEALGSEIKSSMPTAVVHAAAESEFYRAEVFRRLQGQLDRQLELDARNSELLATIAQNTKLSVPTAAAAGNATTWPANASRWGASASKSSEALSAEIREKELGRDRAHASTQCVTDLGLTAYDFEVPDVPQTMASIPPTNGGYRRAPPWSQPAPLPLTPATHPRPLGDCPPHL